MFDGSSYKEEFTVRLSSVKDLVSFAHGKFPPTPSVVDVSRDARGLAILLLFAAYENLLTSLCRGLLEKVEMLGVANKNLKPGFKLFVIYPKLQAISDSSINSVWTDKGKELLDVFYSSDCAVINKVFPIDGSFMKSSQVRVFCDLFDLGDPAIILREVWGRIDTIVTQRNHIAHGVEVPVDIGKGYSEGEIIKLIEIWQLRWCEFVDHVQRKASHRDFYEN